MKKKFYLLLIPLVFGCKKDLTGHWHAKMVDNENFQTSIDVLKNNDSYIYNSLSFPKIKGQHHSDKNQIDFPGLCGDLSFDYVRIGNTLYIENALGAKLIAKKQIDTCEIFKDFKTLLNIDFLKIEKQRALYKPKKSMENEGLSHYFNIDFDPLKNQIRIEYFDEIKTLNDVNRIIKSIEISVSDAEIPFINYVLTPDKNLKASDLKRVINQLNQNYRKKIFIRTLKKKPEKMNIFEFIIADTLILNSNNKLSYFIN